MRVAVVAGLAVLLLLPAAHAGLRITAVELLDPPGQPDYGIVRIAATGEVDCASLLARNAAQANPTVVLAYNGSGPDLIVGGAGAFLLDATACASGLPVLPLTMQVQATVKGTVPAMQQAPGQIDWWFPETPLDAVDAGKASAPFAIQALPNVVGLATFHERQAVLDDEPVVFRATARNLGNVAFRVAGQAWLIPDGDDARRVPAVVSEVDVAQASTNDFVVTVVPPKGEWRAAQIVGELTFTSLVEPAPAARTSPIDLLVFSPDRPQNQVPGPPVAVLVVAIAGLAAALRRD